MVILRAWSTGIATLTIWFGAASAQSLDSLYEAAKKEAVLVVVGGDEARAKTLRQRYEAFTGPLTSSGTYR
jgi:hypothetical protein